jgi:hypothetical protein
MRTTVTLGAAVLGLAAAAAPAAAEAGPPTEIKHRTLLVRGGAEADAIGLEVPRFAPHVLRLQVGDEDYELKRSRFDRIRIESGAGDDEVRITARDLEPVHMDGGDGFDAIVAEGSDAGERFELSADDGAVRVSQDHGRVRASTDGVEAVETFGRGGSDTIDIDDLTGAELQSLVVELGTVRGFESADGSVDRVSVEGTSAGDHIVAFGVSDFVSVFGTPETVSIANPDPSDRLTIDGRSGDDTISTSSDAIAQTLLGGDGDDELFGSPREDVVVGGDGADEVIGFDGDDVAYLGDDADVYLWEPGNGSDVVEGGSGRDSIELLGADAAERFDLSAHGGRLRVSRDDAAGPNADEVESITARARGGADTITVGDLRRTDVDEVHPDLAAGSETGTDPDGAPDRVVVTGTERRDAIAIAGQGRSVTVDGLPALFGITQAEPFDTLAVRTAGGRDTVDSSGLPAGVIGLVVE